MRLRNLALLFSLTVLCLAQGAWQTATDINGVDFQGLTAAQRQAALKFLREEQCTCGCSMKLAQCRMADPSCATSRKLANAAVKDFRAGEKAEEVRADIKKIAGEPPPVLEAPVKIITTGDPYKGPENARVTMVEFSDFQCPFCSRAVAQANELVKGFPKDLKLVFKQFPLDTHNEAEFAAEAALAAHAQGKFWQMHDLLYAGFPDLSDVPFRLCEEHRSGHEPVHARMWTATSSRRPSTTRSSRVKSPGSKVHPTFFINGKRYNGVFDASSVAPLIRQELK